MDLFWRMLQFETQGDFSRALKTCQALRYQAGLTDAGRRALETLEARYRFQTRDEQFGWKIGEEVAEGGVQPDYVYFLGRLYREQQEVDK